MISSIKDNVALYFVILNFISSIYLIINKHIIAGVLIIIITMAIMITCRRNKIYKNTDNAIMQNLSNLISYMPFNVTITDSTNNKITSNIKNREVLNIENINHIFKNTESANENEMLFKNSETILKARINNEIKYYYTNNKAIEDNGVIIGYINYECDVTDIINYKQQLHKRNTILEFSSSGLEEQINNEEKDILDNKRDFQDIIDNNNDGVLIFAYNTLERRVLGFIDSNFAARQMIQQQGFELRNIDIYDLFHNSEKDRIEKILGNMVGDKPILFETLMMINNNIFPVEINAHLCKVYNQDSIYLSIRDIKLRKELEIKRDKDRLIAIKNNKTESIVQTLSIIFVKITCIIKEIKEQIAIIDNNYSTNYNTSEETRNITKSLDNINKTIKDMMSLYTLSNIKVYIDIQTLIESIKEKMFFKEISHNTEIQVIQKGEIKEIYCDEDALKYVIITAISFALENININKGTNFYGKINIILQELNNNYILLSIEDNAGGLDNNIISRIFDIFYSTKINSTGLELPTCKVIVEEILLGTMSISNIDNGSRIDIQISK